MADVGAFQGVTKQKLAILLNPAPNPYLQSVVNQPVLIKKNSGWMLLLLFVAGILVGVIVCIVVFYFKNKT